MKYFKAEISAWDIKKGKYEKMSVIANLIAKICCRGRIFEEIIENQ